MKDLEEKFLSYDFFQAVRWIQSRETGAPRIGQSLSPAQDPVRFGQKPSLTFAPGTIEGFNAGTGGKPPKMFVRFMGLLGPHGPLPLHLTEWARDRERNASDPTLVEFLDIFHHRMVSLFFLAWANSQKTVDLDREDGQKFSEYFASLIGLGMDSLRDRDGVSDWAKFFYSGRLSASARNAEGLRAILGDYFGVPVEIETFVGHWIQLPEMDQCRLGASRRTGVLGETVVLGARFWDCQMKFRIRLGPLDLEEYERLLPCGEAFGRMRDWVRHYAGDELCWDMEFVLKAPEVPEVCLGKSGLLGCTTWLKTLPFAKDAADLKLNPPLA